MTRAIFTWFAGVGMLACTQTTRLHMEEVEDNGGAAGEAQTADGDADTGSTSAEADAASGDDATTAQGGAGGGVGNSR